MKPRHANSYVLKIPGMDPGRPTRRVDVLERDLQNAVVEALRFDGLTVLETDRQQRRVFCKGCRRWFFVAIEETDRGIPDLLVTSDRWPPFTFYGLEMKRRQGIESKEQGALSSRRRIDVLYSGSAEEAITEARVRVRRFEQNLL